MNGDFFGWDIGGAHLKVASLDPSGRLIEVRQLACPLWQGLEQLDEACATLGLAGASASAVHAITMTGELCDIFHDRASGVREILARVTAQLDARARLRVYAGTDGWLTPDAAGAATAAVASANWHALATLVAEFVRDGILLDIGSTTTDVIPIEDGEVASRGRDDATRLEFGELVYTGVARTPVMAVCRKVPIQGRWQSLAAELFATMADVHRLLGELDESHDQLTSADGRAKDTTASARRLARMLGRDLDHDATPEDMRGVAAYLAGRQRRAIEDAVAVQASRATRRAHTLPLIGAGAGSFVAAQLARGSGREYLAFETLIGADAELARAAALAAPAVAVAKLAWMTR